MNNRQITLATLIFFTLFSSLFSSSQNLFLENAVALYQLGQYDQAKDQIVKSINKSEEGNGQVWYYYYLIHEKMDSDPSSTSEMVTALHNIRNIGEEGNYFDQLPEMVHNLENEIDKRISVASDSEEKIRHLKDLLILNQFKDEPLSEVLIRIGELFIEFNSPDSSFKYLDQAIYEGDQSIKVLAILGKLKAYNAMNDDEQFNNLLDSAMRVYPGNTDLLLAKTELLIADGLLFKAKVELNDLLKNQPNNHNLYIKLGEINESLNLIEEAMEEYGKAHDISPTSFDVNFKLAVYHKEKLSYGEGTESEILGVRQLLENAEKLEAENVDLLKEMEDFYLNIRDVENYNRVRFKLRSLEN